MSLKEKILKNKKLAAIIGATALVCVVALVVILLVCCDGKGSDENSGSGKENGETTSVVNDSKEDESTEDIEEAELEKVLDYYVDIKKLKHLNSKALKDKLTEFKQTKNEKIKTEIINSQLKDILYLCLNYSTLHKNIDVQDLVQVANLGLINAIEKFEPTAKIEFKDYMVYYIRESIKNEYEEKDNG